MNNKGVIFLLENSTDYLFLLDQAFRKAQLNCPLRVARYGNEAILYLKGVGIYADRKHYPLPELILLDLAIPDGSGLAVLGWLRRQPELARVPVIILVQAAQENRLVQDAFDRGANAYYMKRDDLVGLVRMIRSLDLISAAEIENSPPDGQHSSHNLSSAV